MEVDVLNSLYGLCGRKTTVEEDDDEELVGADLSFSRSERLFIAREVCTDVVNQGWNLTVCCTAGNNMQGDYRFIGPSRLRLRYFDFVPNNYVSPTSEDINPFSGMSFENDL